jgi:hypothetical protein
MVDGFWTVEFQGIPNFLTGGVATLFRNRIFGGDSEYFYLGTYGVNGSEIVANIQAIAFIGGARNVFGTAEKHFSISLVGSVQGSAIIAKGSRSDAPQHSIVMRLTKRADLPIEVPA